MGNARHLVSNSGIVKGMPGRAQALPVPCHLAWKDHDTLIEQANVPLKQSVKYNLLCKYV